MADFDGVRTTLASYFDALYYCDTVRLRAVFHPEAIYATADEEAPLFRRMPEYEQVVAARRSPASRDEPRRDVIERIEFAGERTALARVRCSIGNRDFVDFLSLLRIDGEWRIVAKIFQISHQPT